MSVSVSDLRPPPVTGNVFLDVLIYDRWVFRQGYVITYVLKGASGDLGPGGGAAWAANGAADAFRAAAATWTAVANVRIVEAGLAWDGSGPRPAVTWVEDLVQGSTFAGEHSLPGPGQLGGSYNIGLQQWSAASLRPGGVAFSTIVHELGHGLGLKHPHPDSFDPKAFPGVTNDSSTGDNELNDGLWTIMSYNNSYRNAYPFSHNWGWEMGPMAFDIAAVQAIYGPNMTTATGDDVYRLPDMNQSGTGFRAIWDAGGIDTIVYDGSRRATIDLRAATLRNEPGGGGFLSSAEGIGGGFTIAAGVVIENARGGSGADRITGNDAANRLEGGGGRDTIDGLGGDDLIIGGLILRGGEGNDVVRPLELWPDSAFDGGPGRDRLDLTLVGQGVTLTLGEGLGTGFEELVGTALDDRLTGDAGPNLIDPGPRGADRLDGGEGLDTLSFTTRARALVIDASVGAAWDGEALVSFTGFERIAGSPHADTIFGGETLDDWILWSGGADRIWGGGGRNTLSFENAPGPVIIDYDVLAAWDGVATATFEGFTRIIGSAFDDVIFGSEAYGEIFEWSPGADDLYGGGGLDIISYAEAPRPVIVDFNEGLAFDGVHLDRLRLIEGAIGSAFDDRIFGREDGPDLIDGGPGGADFLYGGGGVDTVSYASSLRPVIIDLAAGRALDGVAQDVLVGFENAVGSAFDDQIFGDAGSNTLDGGPGGRDRLWGGPGDDWFVVRPVDEGDMIMDFEGGLAGDRILLAGFAPDFTTSLEPDGISWRIEALGGAQWALVTVLGPVLPTDWVLG